MKSSYDVIVIGGGHAGCEAALAASRRGHQTLMITLDPGAVGRMSCNPSIGGLAKGQLAREIDALGGEMGRNADATAIQFRLLNTKKGAAVQAYRVQSDKYAYEKRMQDVVAAQDCLELGEGMVSELILENSQVQGVVLSGGVRIACQSVIITSGTFLNGYIHRGLSGYDGGRDGEESAIGLTDCLMQAGFRTGRLKTGTPARIHKDSIDFTVMEEQPSDQPLRTFSFDPPDETLPHISCYVAYSTLETKKLVEANLDQSPMYAGHIEGIGPRYCPSFEDKVVRFPDRDRHQLFLEPEGLTTDEYYVNGLSTSLPADVQLKMLQSVKGLENVEVIRYGYAVEYDFIYPNQLHPTLETKKISGLYLAGQVNGTSGYEEAGAQGLVAGVNASLKLSGDDPLILRRNEAYIGVLIDDLITKSTEEPYRMFTSQAEHRLALRNDNADIRLTDIGFRIGLISQERYRTFIEKKKCIESELERLTLLMKQETSWKARIKGGSITVDEYPEVPGVNIKLDIKEYILSYFKYIGYMDKQDKEAQKMERFEGLSFPPTIDYDGVVGLKKEACEKLKCVQPSTLGQASRIMGVTPSDLAILLVYIEKHRREVGSKC